MRFKHAAFTMLELVFVIVIMGIIGKFGVEFLAQAYNSFIFSKINHELQSNSEAAVEFIAKRLEGRIKDSVIARTEINGTVVAVADATGDSFTVLEWIASDEDGFRGNSLPNWSGIIDLGSNTSNGNALYSPETNTSAENRLITVLSNNDSNINDGALYFIGSDSDIQSGYGWNGQITDQNRTMHPINNDANISQFIPAAGTGNFHEVYEYYKLSWTANAIVLQNNNLYFYYNYQPWKGEIATDGKRSLLMQNVSTFRFTAIGSIIKIQVCAKSTVLSQDGGDYSLCKEKTVF
ncbi:protein containing prepilin-type N- cleavage/methylation domain protein [Sulfurimonas sediminis]|uniref:Protein containing prepilin-type N-cleavage/methylation domain protein n=1 Tax=Sulfurimonas sediminis TaxID=2590020 RepID=A0A7M1B3G9_9BACT|nr:protein containing prepilin-type N- cleavage/methylation domain protein [Sulfurimonas sediminis]QOP44297.1 protein containing prepilin-type N- cleavage/methylation domain protein [Sulfurimonas sediminis]